MEGRETRKFYLMRHGERLDYVFGDWMSQCFNKYGDYFPTNLNMPDTIPKRPQGHHVYLHDPPLTKTGIFQAQLTGEAFKKAQLDVSHVYCSPSLRCIQTCDAFLKGCSKKSEIKIRVEPGLYEWWVVFGDRLPDWLTPKELAEEGFNIDLEYKPIITIDELGSRKETFAEYCSRCLVVSTEAVNAHAIGNVLFVAHGGTLAVCSWEITGEKSKPMEEAKDDVSAIPYCGFMEVRQTGDNWEKNGSPFLQFSHTSNAVFDYNRLL
ncbi:ecdysteroid-phosphate phosphatase-like [Zophobas morio]|uniref:ecdysteroid-phosphate phosphatase-like n=1 Tax=Zophobas morio TaxID=2755281 RepID=UPI003083B857